MKIKGIETNTLKNTRNSNVFGAFLLRERLGFSVLLGIFWGPFSAPCLVPFGGPFGPAQPPPFGLVFGPAWPDPGPRLEDFLQMSTD